jgi:signal transduction histidine kinase
MGLTRRSAAVADVGSSESERRLLLAVDRELGSLVKVLTSTGATDLDDALRADLVHRLDLCAEAARAVAGRADPTPARRLLALGAIGAIGLDLAGLQVDRHVGPLPAGLAPESAGLVEQAIVSLVANVHAHARARHAVLALVTGHAAVELVVADDGCGFDLDDVEHPLEARTGSLAAARLAVQTAGGSFAIETAPGRGTRVTVKVPRPSGDRDRPCTW